jgi:hypothetical protein
MSHQSSSVNDLPQPKPGQANEKAPSLMIPIFKLPVFLYRLRLGWLLGKRFRSPMLAAAAEGAQNRPGGLAVRREN